MMTDHVFRCRKCRYRLLDGGCVVTEHNLSYFSTSNGETSKESINPNGCSNGSTLWYIQTETAPDWIREIILQSQWTRGKLSCPKCKGRLGSFDFTSAVKCLCGQSVLPPVHFQQNRVDHHQVNAMSNSNQYKIPIRKTFVSKSACGDVDGIEGSNDVDSETSDLPKKQCSDREHICEKAEDTLLNEMTLNVANSSIVDGKEREELCLAQITTYNRFEGFCDMDKDNNRVMDDKDTDKEEKNKSFIKKRRKAKNENCSKGEEDTDEVIYPDEHTCAVCYELYRNPMSCAPCGHIFCEPCLRRLARSKPFNTQCPLCRNIIVNCVRDQDLSQLLLDLYPEKVKKRKHNERKCLSSKFYKLPRKDNSLNLQYARDRQRNIRRQNAWWGIDLNNYFVQFIQVLVLLYFFLYMVIVPVPHRTVPGKVLAFVTFIIMITLTIYILSFVVKAGFMVFSLI